MTDNLIHLNGVLAPNSHPAMLYTAEQSRELDRLAIEEHKIPGIVLMKRAGRAVFDLISQRYSDLPRITVVCGAGNNAGDGFIIAALARRRLIPVDVLMLSKPHQLKGDAEKAYAWAVEQGVQPRDFASAAIPTSGVLVDAMLGTGLRGDVRPAFAAAIEQANNADLPVIAVDIPSGLCSDTGKVLGNAVRADATVTFIGAKRGLYTAAGPQHCGDIYFAGLDVPGAVFSRINGACALLSVVEGESCLPRRPRDAHKGNFGHVLVIGGDCGMGGAALMASEAAARCGAGLVSVATRSEHVAGFLAHRPEAMVHAVASRGDVEALLLRASVLAIGPGLGAHAWGEGLLQAALEAGLPAVLDADALNMLATRPSWRESLSGHVITPHPGEAARLLGTETADVQRDRFGAAQRLARELSCTVVLKGAGTVICSEDGSLAVCPFGNPGMASGGMGDVLSGVIAGLLAQGLNAFDAATTGTVIHSRAADLAARHGERGLLATDLMPEIRRLVNGV